jgi:hypothetical protein
MNVSKFKFVLSPNVPQKQPIPVQEMDWQPDPESKVVQPRYLLREPVVPPPDSISDPLGKPYERLENVVLYRLEWINFVRNKLLGVQSVGTCLDRLKQTLDLGEMTDVQVGKNLKVQQRFTNTRPEEVHIANSGSTSTVYKAYLRDSLLYPLAIKNFKDLSENAQSECVVLPFFDPLVQLNICPHYVLLVKSFFCFQESPERPISVNIVQEYATMSVHHLLVTREHLSDVTLYSLIFQTFMGLFCSHMYLGVVHNDIKFDNILLNLIELNTIFQYQFFDTATFRIHSTGYLFKIADWGLATGDLVKRDHSYAPNIIAPSDTFNIKRTDNPVVFLSEHFETHPLAFRVEEPGMTEPVPISPWKRDYLSFCYMLMHYYHYQRNLPVRFLHTIISEITQRNIQSAEDLIPFFMSIFHNKQEFSIQPDDEKKVQRFSIQRSYPFLRDFLVAKGITIPESVHYAHIYGRDALSLLPGPTSLVLT